MAHETISLATLQEVVSTTLSIWKPCLTMTRIPSTALRLLHKRTVMGRLPPAPTLQILARLKSIAVCQPNYISPHILLKYCPACEHRSIDGGLELAEMVRLECESTFRCFEPLEEYRMKCPRVLVVCRHQHAHPIPLPSKTPPMVRQVVFDMLANIKHDLSDLTPRRFLRHSFVRAYLHKRFPNTHDPCFADLHISLANREHIKTYITQVQSRCFPFGTGWKGECYY